MRARAGPNVNLGGYSCVLGVDRSGWAISSGDTSSTYVTILSSTPSVP